MRTDKMASTHDRPHWIGAAGAVYQQRAARLVGGKICLFVDAGRLVSARPGIVPCMPLLGSQPKAVYLVYGKFPLDILRQVVGLCNVHKDVIPATVAAAQPATRNDAVFVSQAIQRVCRRFIYGRIHAVDEVLLRCNWKLGFGFLGAQGDIDSFNQVNFFPFLDRYSGPSQGNTPGRREPPPTGIKLSGYLTFSGLNEQL